VGEMAKLFSKMKNIKIVFICKNKDCGERQYVAPNVPLKCNNCGAVPKRFVEDLAPVSEYVRSIEGLQEALKIAIAKSDKIEPSLEVWFESNEGAEQDR
jgi:hypothetical protein